MSVIYNEYSTTAYQDKNYPNMQGARQDLIMGLLLDPTNDEVLSILSRLFPGKSVGDVINSRASDSAKIALRNMLYPPVPIPKTTETVASTVDPDEGQVTKDPGLMSASAKSEWSQSDTDISNVEERMYQSGRCIPNLKACIEEKEFNLKLAEEKKKVHEDVKSVLIDRQTLKYKGGRVCPLPPPSAKPLYGGRAFKRKTKIANRGGTNWRQFTQGIPVVDA